MDNLNHVMMIDGYPHLHPTWTSAKLGLAPQR